MTLPLPLALVTLTATDYHCRRVLLYFRATLASLPSPNGLELGAQPLMPVSLRL